MFRQFLDLKILSRTYTNHLGIQNVGLYIPQVFRHHAISSKITTLSRFRSTKGPGGYSTFILV